MNRHIPWHVRFSVVPTLIMVALVLAVVMAYKGIIGSMTLLVLLLTLAPAYMAALVWNSERVIKYEQRT